jgi:hypothetical protein
MGFQNSPACVLSTMEMLVHRLAHLRSFNQVHGGLIKQQEEKRRKLNDLYAAFKGNTISPESYKKLVASIMEKPGRLTKSPRG